MVATCDTQAASAGAGRPARPGHRHRRFPRRRGSSPPRSLAFDADPATCRPSPSPRDRQSLTADRLRQGTRDAILDAQRAPDGKLYDPNTGLEIPEGGGHFGHRPGFEWWRTQQMAREQGWTREQLIEYENDPSHDWYEDPYSNMSHQFELPR